MAFSFSGIDVATNLGKTLHILQTKGLINALNNDDAEFELFRAMIVEKAKGRSFTYRLQTNSGMARVRAGAVGDKAFPAAAPLKAIEATGQYKEMKATIEFEGALWRAIQASPSESDIELLMTELEQTIINNKRYLSLVCQGDGTGAILTVNSANVAISGGKVVVTQALSVGTALARGAVAWAQIGDKLYPFATDGTRHDVGVASGTVDYYEVDSVDRDAGTVTLIVRNAADTALTANGVGTVVATDIFYRSEAVSAAGAPDVSGAIADYGSVSASMLGLDSLSAADGRTVNGVVHSGLNAGTVINNAGGVLGLKSYDKLVRALVLRNGRKPFSWTKAHVDPAIIDFLVESQEDSRRMVPGQDPKVGAGSIGFISNAAAVTFMPSEFARPDVIRLLPEGVVAGGRKILELRFNEFEPVKFGGETVFPKPSADGGFLDQMVSYMTGRVGFACLRPSAIGTLTNFIMS
jgi:hypothetical protein